VSVRHNACPNPATANDVTGWTSNGLDPTRTDVTGLGFVRTWAAKYTDGSVLFSPQGAASAGQAYTVSVYARPISFTINGSIFIEFLDSGHSSLAFSSSGFTAPANGVTRISQSDTAPTNTAYVRIVITGENYASNATYYSQCLIEQSGSLNAWFDGDSSGASWDGTAGSSTSTLSDSVSLSRDVTDSLTVSDTLTRSLSLPRSVTDSVTAGDSLTRLVALSRPISDSATVSDALTSAGARSRTAADTLSVTDSVTAAVTLARNVTDSLTVADVLTRTAAHPRSVTDGLTVGDSATRAAMTFTRSATDTLFLIDDVHYVGEPLATLHNLGGSLVAARNLGGSVVSGVLGGSLD
jgi:hypothetical protein